MAKKLKRGPRVPGNLTQIGSNWYIKDLPLDELYSRFKDHRRLRVFAEKGLKCVNPECDKVGSRLVKNMDNGGTLHVDLFTEDGHLMTIDHIHPKSKGGSNEIENLQPMCAKCNHNKGNKVLTENPA